MADASLGGEVKTVEVARALLLAYLPSSLQEETTDAFADIIYEMFEKTFALPRDAIDSVQRFPRLDLDGKEFGCKCFISFRSRVHKHRVIAQKSKLETPTKIETFTEIPKEFYEPEDELEMADECGDEEEEEEEAEMDGESEQSADDSKGEEAGDASAEADVVTTEVNENTGDDSHTPESGDVGVNGGLATHAESVDSPRAESTSGSPKIHTPERTHDPAAESAHTTADDITIDDKKVDSNSATGVRDQENAEECEVKEAKDTRAGSSEAKKIESTSEVKVAESKEDVAVKEEDEKEGAEQNGFEETEKTAELMETAEEVEKAAEEEYEEDDVDEEEDEESEEAEEADAKVDEEEDEDEEENAEPDSIVYVDEEDEESAEAVAKTSDSEATNGEKITKGDSSSKQEEQVAKPASEEFKRRECKFDIHLEPYSSLPVDREGAPEFQWKVVLGPVNCRTLVIENAMPCDMLSPWLYVAVLRAVEVSSTFSRHSLEDSDQFVGRIELVFASGITLCTCILNYLVHFRTSCSRRIRIFIPQTKTTLHSKADIEKRLGRVRKTLACQAQLVMKPLPKDVTEQKIREDVFKGFNVQRIEFRNDLLENRCALVTFGSAEEAIAAHSARDIVQFANKKGAPHTKVLYAYARIRHWGLERSLDDLLTSAEWKVFQEAHGGRSVVGRWGVQAKRATGDAAENKTEKGEADNDAASVTQKRSASSAGGDAPFAKKTRWSASNRGSGVILRGAYASARGRPSLRRGWSPRAPRGTFRAGFRGSLGSRGSFEPRGSSFRGNTRPFSRPRGGPGNFGPRGSFRSPQNAYRRGTNAEGPFFDRREGARGYENDHSSSYMPPPDRGERYDSYGYNDYPPRQSERSHMDAGEFMEERYRDQRKQYEMEEHMIRQQQIIDDLAGELRARGSSSAATGYAPEASYSNAPGMPDGRSFDGGPPMNGPRDHWDAPSFRSDFNGGNDQGSSAGYGMAWR